MCNITYTTYRFGFIVIRSKKSFGFGWIFGEFCLLYKCNRN